MQITSEKLYELCRKYGRQARLWRQKFIGLLPEVNRRRLYEKNGSSSIFEFAAKLCGLSAEQVRLALNLDRRCENMPILRGMLERGDASINKLSRVVSIATVENEEELAAMIKVLSLSALSTLVRDEKYARTQNAVNVDEKSPQASGLVPCPSGTGQIQMHVFEEVNGLDKPPFGLKGLLEQTRSATIDYSCPPSGRNLELSRGEVEKMSTLNFQLDDDVQKELNELKFKGIDVNELLREMLKRRKEEISDIKQKLANEQKGKEATRHVPVKIERVLNLEYGTKCAVPNCAREARHIHHELPFAMVKNHDPFSMKPLCEEHHELFHSIDLKYHQARKAATG